MIVTHYNNSYFKDYEYYYFYYSYFIAADFAVFVIPPQNFSLLNLQPIQIKRAIICYIY